MTPKQRLLAGITAGAVSAAGLGLIATHEGKRNETYADPAHGWAVPTVCYGHTATAARGQWRSDQECLHLLQQDATGAYQHVRRLTRGVGLTQGEVDAWTSFVFNVGPGNFERSTARRLILAGDRVAACNQLPRWTFAAGKQLPGLIKRRAEERALCLRDLT